MLWNHIIGHAKVISILSQQSKAGRLGHAYLFVGPHGIGKRLVAKAFAAANLYAYNDGFTHQDIERVQDNKHPDVQIWETEKNSLGVNDIRNWQKNVWLPPSIAHRKFFLIDEAEKLTTQAQNVLLKTLEEPPLDTVFILLTDNIAKILPTVLSRCRLIRFAPLNRDDLWKLLNDADIAEDKRPYLINSSNGSIGQALVLANSVDLDLLFTFVERLLKALGSRGYYNVLAISEEISKSAIDINIFLYTLETLWVMALRNDNNINDIIASDVSFIIRRDLYLLHKDCRFIEQASRQLNQYLNKQFVLETLFLRLMEDYNG